MMFDIKFVQSHNIQGVQKKFDVILNANISETTQCILMKLALIGSKTTLGFFGGKFVIG